MTYIKKKKCSKCGVEQHKPGMCWEDGKCSKCYYGESMTEVKRNVIVTK